MNTIGDRLKDERQRLGMNQTDFGAAGGVQKGAQINYEKGDRYPDAGYLSAIAMAGADVAYILTGKRTGDAEWTAAQLTSHEMALLHRLRNAPREFRELVDALMEWAPTIEKGASVKK
jgi:transcriptional regulator with XRE-family HTH domain